LLVALRIPWRREWRRWYKPRSIVGMDPLIEIPVGSAEGSAVARPASRWWLASLLKHHAAVDESVKAFNFGICLSSVEFPLVILLALANLTKIFADLSIGHFENRSKSRWKFCAESRVLTL